MMKARDILYTTSWDDLDIGTCKLFIKFFDQYIPIILFQDHQPKARLSVKMVQAVNEIFDMHDNEQELYQDEFNKNKAIKVKEIHVDQENDILDGVYCEIIMDAGPEYLSFILKNGIIVAVDTDGTYLSSLKDELA